MRRSSLAALILLSTSAPALSAQSSEAGTPPTRIRLVPVDVSWKPMTGTLVSLGADTIQLVLDGRRDTSRVLAATLDRIERSTSRRSGLGRGVLFGVLIGGAIGGGAGYAMSSPGASEPAPYMVPAGIGAGALIGGVIGGLRGASSRGERWEAMPTVSVDRAQSGAAPAADVRVGFATRLNF
jgi:hypothetical protein